MVGIGIPTATETEAYVGVTMAGIRKSLRDILYVGVVVMLPVQLLAQTGTVHCEGIEGRIIDQWAVPLGLVSTSDVADVELLPSKLLSNKAADGKSHHTVLAIDVGPQLSSIDKVTGSELTCTSNGIILTINMTQGAVSTAAGPPRRPVIELSLYVDHPNKMLLQTKWVMREDTSNGSRLVDHTDHPYQKFPITITKTLP